MKTILLLFLVSTSAWCQTVGDGGVSTYPGGVLAPSTFVLGLPVTGASFPSITRSAIGAGDVDLFTSPTGKRTLITSMGGYNAGGNSVTWFAELKVGSSYYRVMNSITTLSGATSTVAAISIILEPGESISVNTTASGINLSAGSIQFDSTSQVKTIKLRGTAAGNQTMYTTPAGKTDFITNTNGPLLSAGSSFSESAASVTASVINVCLIPSGGTATCANNSTGQMVGANGVGAGTRNNLNAFSVSMNAGDMIVLNVTGNDAGQMVWFNVFEM